MKRWENTLHTLWNYSICSFDFRYTEAVIPEISSEQVLLKISQCWSLFLIKLQAFRPAILLKRDSNIGAFLWNLQNLLEHFFIEHFRRLLAASGNILWTLSLYCIWQWWIVSLRGTYWLSSANFILLRVFRFFLFSFFLCGFYYLLRYWGKLVNT